MTKKIAHIDDDPDIRDTVKRVLTMHGYQVDSYHTSSDFIHSLDDSEKVPDLAILDVMVESMDAGLTTYIKLHDRFPNMHAIFMTSLGDTILPYFENKSQEWVCILEKPVQPTILLNIIQDRLGKAN